MGEVKRTALYDQHVTLGARLVHFGGWEMPVQYAGISREHQAVRTAVGLFDVSHMGEFFLRGTQAEEFAQYVTTNDVRRLTDGRAQYTTMLHQDGTIIDDLLIYRFASDRYMMVVNAANTESDFEWIRSQNDMDVDLENVSDATALLAVQGPKAEAMLQSLTSCDLSKIASFGFVEAPVAGIGCVLSRTGYTGEDGFELYLPWVDSPQVWESVRDAGRSFGIEPVGLGARNTLRLEAALMLYGNDIDRSTSPLEAGIEWVVRFDKGEFVGRKALIEQKSVGIQRSLCGFRMLGREIARDGYAALADHEAVGRVTSGGPSITLEENIGLAYLPLEYASEGTRFQVQVRKHLGEAEVVKLPFYRRRRSV